MKKTKNKIAIWFSFFLSFIFYVPIWAYTDYGQVDDNAPDPPPSSPIDNYLILLIFGGIFLAGFFFYKTRLTSLKKEN